MRVIVDEIDCDVVNKDRQREESYSWQFAELFDNIKR